MKWNPNGFAALVVDHTDTDADFWGFDGSRRAERWPRLQLAIHAESGDVTPKLFYMFTAAVLIAASSVFAELGNFCSSEVCELLPAYSDELGDLQLMNVVRIVDCFDEERSELDWFDAVARYEFQRTKLPSAGWFKVPETAVSDILISEPDGQPSLVELLGRSGLDKGWTLELVWQG
jgi:hypothetical protein